MAATPPADCMLCALPLSGKHDGWAHDDCARVVKADDEAHQVTDRRALEVVEREMRAQGLCPHQIRPNGWDGSAIYCGQGIIEHGDKPNLYCLEHECEAWGDEEGAAQERWERTLELLERDRRS